MFAEMHGLKSSYGKYLSSVGIVTTRSVKADLLHSHLARCKETARVGSQLLLQVKKSFKLGHVSLLLMFFIKLLRSQIDFCQTKDGQLD